MKTALLSAALLLPLCALAQPAAPTIVERGPHHRVWRWSTDQTGPDGRTRNQPHSYVELATGLCYQQDAQGPWLDAQEVIEVLPDGSGVARQGQHQVEFPVNLKEGLIGLRTPDGKQFRSRPLGLVYYDAATGQSVLIAELQDAPGKLVAPNTVLYPDAFDDVTADVRLVYRLASFEADVILRDRRLPDPERWGLDPRTTRLQVWTEFLEAPAGTRETVVRRAEPDARMRQAMTEPDFTDQRLDFGAMQIGEGRAFVVGKELASAAALEEVPVGKEWTTARDEAGQERTFLIESVELPALQPLLDALPSAGASLPSTNRAARTAAVRRPASSRTALLAQLPKAARRSAALAPPPSARAARLTQLAANFPPSGLQPPPGVVLDYTLLNAGSVTNFIFRGDTTYFVSGACNLRSNTIMEGGAVIKFTNGSSAKLNLYGPLDCRTSLGRPAVFTAKDDDTIGTPIAGSSGNPTGYYGDPALNLYTNTHWVFGDMRFRHVLRAIRVNSAGGQSLSLQNVQMGYGLRLLTVYHAACTNWLRNVLLHDLTYEAVYGGTNNHGEHLTLHRVNRLVSDTNYPICLTNSLLIAVTNNLAYLGTHVESTPSDTEVFQTVGGGAHYLADDSPYRDAGTTNLSPAMLAALKDLTTYPPIFLTNPITLDTTLAPQAARDVDAPDLGYHYPPLDYLVSGVTVTNATLLATNGVVVGVDYSRSSWGFDLRSAQYLSQGTATQPNRLVRAHNVQEQSSGNPGTRACFFDGASADAENVLRLRHTEFAQLAADGYFLYAGTRFRDLEWTHSGVYNPSLVLDIAGGNLLRVGVTNTLWHRGGVMFGVYGSSTNASMHLRNNLWRFVSLHFVGGTTNWTVRDNLFDRPFYLGDHGSAVSNSHNGYYLTNVPNFTLGPDNVHLSECIYEQGPLGPYYYPTNAPGGGGTNLYHLLNAGSRTADLAGLYHYTVTVDQAKETNSPVDIGLHYVAVTNIAGLWTPLDTDGDGLPDYLEDANGNGTTDSGETDWLSASDQGLRVFITRPKSGAKLP